MPASSYTTPAFLPVAKVFESLFKFDEENTIALSRRMHPTAITMMIDSILGAGERLSVGFCCVMVCSDSTPPYISPQQFMFDCISA
jgi:hypothetical protein